MEDEECNRVAERLLDALRRVGLEWVVDQINEEVRLGRTVEREVETFKGGRATVHFAEIGSAEYSSQFRRGPKATFPVTEEYRPPERLRLVLGAIEQAVVNATDMEHGVFAHLGDAPRTSGLIAFLPEEGEAQGIRIEPRQSTSRLEASRKLRELIDALRREI